MKSRLLFVLFSITLLLSSCAISNSFSIGDSKYLDLWGNYQFNDNEILATYVAENNHDAVKIITFGEHYSPAQRIQGNFTCVDYYTYETMQGIIKTVPVVVKTSDYEKYLKYMKTHKQ